MVSRPLHPSTPSTPSSRTASFSPPNPSSFSSTSPSSHGDFNLVRVHCGTGSRAEAEVEATRLHALAKGGGAACDGQGQRSCVRRPREKELRAWAKGGGALVLKEFALKPRPVVIVMGSASSMLTQYDIEEVQEHCNNLFSQQEIVSLYERFCQLDRNGKGFISADEFLSVPEFSMNPLSQRLLKMVDGINFKDFVAFLSAFSAKASAHQKIELIFKVYDSDRNGKVSFKDILEVLKDLSGPFMSDEQRECVLGQLLKEAGYTQDSYLTLDDFIKALGQSELKMDVEVPVD